MTGIMSLWLPIVVSAAAVFLGSSVIHMMLPWHRDDYPRLPNEDAVINALQPLAIPPGDYMLPRAANMEEMRSPEFAAKAQRGPVIVMTVMPNGIMPISRSLVQWFIYSLVVGILAAYITGRALPHGAAYLDVFRFAGATAFIAYSAALWQMSIWYRRSWTITMKSTIDGLVYGLLTAGVFGWLWPR